MCHNFRTLFNQLRLRPIQHLKLTGRLKYGFVKDVHVDHKKLARKGQENIHLSVAKFGLQSLIETLHAG